MIPKYSDIADSDGKYIKIYKLQIVVMQLDRTDCVTCTYGAEIAYRKVWNAVRAWCWKSFLM